MTNSEKSNPALKLENLLKELRVDYIQSLPEKIKRWQAALEAERWQELRTLAHQIKGTGKTYGFPAVSVVAEHLERQALLNSQSKKDWFVKGLSFLREVAAHPDLPWDQHPLVLEILREPKKENAT